MKSRIESLGVYLPETKIRTSELLRRCRVKPRWDFEKITGVSEIHVCEKETSFDMVLNAAKDALASSKYGPTEIDLLICSSLSRFDSEGQSVYEPAMSSRLASALNASRAITFDVVNACAGMFTGIVIIDSFLKAGAINCGLVVSGEQGSKLHEPALRQIKHGLDGQFASLTLGDGAAALILDRSDNPKVGFHCLDFVTGAKYNDLCIGHPAADGTGVAMYTKPVKLHRAGLNNGMPYIKRTLDNTGWHLLDVDYFIPHQTAERTIKRISRKIYEYAKTEERNNQISHVKTYGNTATASHFLALHEHIVNNTVQANNNLMFLIGASGLIIGNATYTLDDLPDRHRTGFSERNQAHANAD